MVKPVFRRKSIGTKVSEVEYAKLEALAGGRALGECVREETTVIASRFRLRLPLWIRRTLVGLTE